MAIDRYPVVEVPDSAADQIEQLGTRPKFWFHRDGQDWLFKEVRPGTGEDWAEKVASEVCSLLQLPCAEYHLAVWKGRRGVITPNFVPEDARLVHGNEVLGRVLPGYPGGQRYKVREHKLDTVVAVLRTFTERLRLRPPIGAPGTPPTDSALGVFLGYLMLDSLIANQDRHHENWALIVAPDGSVYLAPTYDHASSLGRNESDGNRHDRLTTSDRQRGMEAYVRRARSALYESSGATRPLGTLDAFRRLAFRLPADAKSWLDRLHSLEDRRVRVLLERIPDDKISGIGIDFAMEMIKLNRERLLAVGLETKDAAGLHRLAGS